MALGADIAALAAPLFRAAAASAEALQAQLDVLRRQFTIAMFATGSADIPALRRAELTSTGASIPPLPPGKGQRFE
jgi:isopentenyl-diphosphate delta-isomerase